MFRARVVEESLVDVYKLGLVKLWNLFYILYQKNSLDNVYRISQILKEKINRGIFFEKW